jgi:HK97 family phage major capsid protein
VNLIVDLATLRGVEAHAQQAKLVKDRQTEILNEADGRPLVSDAEAEYMSLDEHRIEVEAALEKVKAQAAALVTLSQNPKNTEPERKYTAPEIMRSKLPENLFDFVDYRSRSSSPEAEIALLRDGARKVAEQAVYPHDKATPDRTVGHIHKLLARIDDGSDGAPAGTLARHIIATGSPAYSRAFGKAIAGMGNYLTPSERAAIATVGTTTTGGYAVPFTLDPTVILTSDGALNPLPGIARNEQTVGNTWKGLASAGVTASYGTEAVAVTDGAPTFTQPEVTTRKAKALIEFSIESDQDWPRLQSEMARLLQDAKDTLEAEKFVNGTGTNEPEGVLYGIASTYNVGTTGDGFDTADLRVLTTRLGDRWEPRASWLAHRAVYTEAERLDHAAGVSSDYRPLAAGEPRALLGYPRYNTSAMESEFATATNRVAIFGDFGQFLIVTKIGLTVELIPHLVNGDGNPTGERGLFAYWRNSSVVLVDSAFRVLTIGVVTTGI